MELRDIAAIGRRWLWLFGLSTGLAAVSAWLATMAMPRTYAAQTTLMVGRSTSDPEPNMQAVFVTQQLATLYAEMVTQEPVMSKVVEAAGLEASWTTLRSMVRAAPKPGTPFLVITVIDTDPERAGRIARQTAEQLIEYSPTPTDRKQMESRAFVERQLLTLEESITQAETELRELEGRIGLETSARAIADLRSRRAARESQIHAWRAQYASYLASIKGSEVNSLSIVEEAGNGSPVGPRAGMNVLLAALLGFGLALAAVLLLEYLDDTVKTAEHAERRLGLPGLATIERVEDVESRPETLVTRLQPRSPIAEAFRTLRTNLQFSMLRKEHATLLITSANPGEGKSTTAANLAVVSAQAGKMVILVDSDLRRPSLHRFFDLPNSQGLTSLILDPELAVESVLRPVDDVAGLFVLTSGPLPPNPAEVLGSEAMAGLIEELKSRAGLVILDSPPLLVVTDAAILAASTDGTLLVCDSGETRIDAARRAIASLEKVGVTPVGAVVNKLDFHRGRGYYQYAYRYRYNYGAYYGSDSDGDDDQTSNSGGTAGQSPAGLWNRLRAGLQSLLG